MEAVGGQAISAEGSMGCRVEKGGTRWGIWRDRGMVREVGEEDGGKQVGQVEGGRGGVRHSRGGVRGRQELGGG